MNVFKFRQGWANNMNARLGIGKITERENLPKGLFAGRLFFFSIRTNLQYNLPLRILAFFLLSFGVSQAQSNSSASSNAADIPASNDVATALRIFPKIDGVLPNPAPAVAVSQALVVNGWEFRPDCEVVVRDKITGEAFHNFKFALHHDNQFAITPNFDKSEGQWSVEVINPGGYSSGEFIFDVVAPQHLSAWLWWRSGWPWFWGCLMCGVGLVAVIVYVRHRAVSDIVRAGEAACRTEHERLSRDLHDSVNDLNEVNLLAGKLKLVAEQNGHAGKIRETADCVSVAVVEAVNALEDMIWSSTQENENLQNVVARLHDKIGRFRESNLNLNCVLDFPIDVPQMPVSSCVSAHLLRITSEALRNVIRHADARCVTCHLSVQDSRLRLEIIDDGRGFDQKTLRPSGRGIPSLRRRAEESGGNFDVQSSPGNGTKVRVEVPLHDIPRCGG